MSDLQMIGTVYVDNGDGAIGELRIEQDVRIERSLGPRPDKSWSFVDSAGHFHAYDQHAEVGHHYPTLDEKSEPRGCDGSCGGACSGEGYTVVVRSCRICYETIGPSVVHGEYEFPVPGLKTWTVVVQHPLTGAYAYGQKVSVRFEAKDQQWFGVAGIGDVFAEGSSDGRFSGRTTLHGWGSLGRRALSPATKRRAPAAAG